MSAAGSKSATLDYEVEYNNRLRVPESPAHAAAMAEASAQARADLAAELDLPYGASERNRYDLFLAADRSAPVPLAVYIHGGVWQRGDRKDYSAVARQLVAKGVDVAIPSYTLCPSTTVPAIYDEVRTFLRALWARTRRRPTIVGHSVGGTMAAAMLATDWSVYGDVPADFLGSAYAISGVFEVEPYVHTTYNNALHLDAETARRVSPALWPAPPADRILVAAVGGAESSEFLRQSIDQADRWSQAGLKAECVLIPRANHFTVLDDLSRPDSAMLFRIVDLARRAAVVKAI